MFLIEPLSTLMEIIKKMSFFSSWAFIHTNLTIYSGSLLSVIQALSQTVVIKAYLVNLHTSNLICSPGPEGEAGFRCGFTLREEEKQKLRYDRLHLIVKLADTWGDMEGAGQSGMLI